MAKNSKHDRVFVDLVERLRAGEKVSVERFGTFKLYKPQGLRFTSAGKLNEALLAGDELPRLDEPWKTIASQAVAKRTFRVEGLGTFELSGRKAGMGRNPGTGEPFEIPARKILTFRAEKQLLEALLGPEGLDAHEAAKARLVTAFLNLT